MIGRYSLPEMRRVWDEESKLTIWLEVELAACEAQAELGNIPCAALEEIKSRAGFDVRRVAEIEAVTNHDVVAFLTAVGEKVGESSRYIHLGMTSSDVLDTALAVQMYRAAELILVKLDRLRRVLEDLAGRYKYTLIIGRTHGVHAEPTTFGLKLALWVQEVDRAKGRLRRAQEVAAVGKISGAVGNFANIDPRVEEYVCAKLGLKPEPVSSQVVQRDRHAEYLCQLAVVAASLEKIAVELRNLQRTEILEVEEGFSSGQKGSSAMPHKKNPITCERVTGLARIIRSNALAALENVALWHERDISHSSVERVILPDSAILLDYLVATLARILENLVVHPENMRRNLEMTRGLVFSQRVLLALVGKGVLREQAYEWVQRNALQAWQEQVSFLGLLQADRDVLSYLQSGELAELFNYDYFLRNVDYVFRRAGLDLD